MIIGSVKDLTLTEIIQGFIEFELIFGDKGFNVDFKLILLAPGNEFKAFIVSLRIYGMVLFEGTFCKCFG